MSEAASPSPKKSSRSKEERSEKRHTKRLHKGSSSTSVTEKSDKDGAFRKKKAAKEVVTTILRRPQLIPTDAPSLERDETEELSQFKVDNAALDSFYQPYGASIYNNLNAILRAARQNNTIAAATEFVVVGWLGDGKSSLIEAVLGMPLQPGVPTMRPIHYHLHQNSKLTEPRFALGLPTGIRHTTLEDLPHELKKLNKEFSSVPVHVLIERNACVNMVLIDTPGLGGADSVAKKAQNLVLALAAPGRRYICVEAAPAKWQASPLRTLAHQFDPAGTHTTFVYTAAFVQLRNLLTHEQALKYIEQRPVENAFFVDGLAKGTRAAVDEPAEFPVRVVQAQRRLQSIAKQLGVDGHEAGARLGLKAFLTFLYETGIKDLEFQMPALLETMREQDAEYSAKLTALQREEEALAPHLLRASAGRWAGVFCHAFVNLMNGSICGQPGLNGQTLEEERQAAPAGAKQWSTAAGPVDVELKRVVRHDVRLYGAQQLSRLADEFGLVAKLVQLNEASVGDADVAIGSSAHPPSPYQRQLSAAEIAVRYARQSFGPLVVQLFERAVAVVEHLFALTMRVAAQQTVPQFSTKGQTSAPFDVERFPFLQFKVRDTLSTAVRHLAAVAQDKALDDLQCFFYEAKEDDPESISELAVLIFDRMRDQALHNVVLKFQVFFVNRAGVVLSRAVHAALAQLGDSEIERLFQVNEYKARIANERATLSVLQRRVADSKHMLVSRKVAAQDPSIRKSFIVRMPKKPAKVRKERSGLSKSARAPVEEKATDDDETSNDDNVAESEHNDDESDEVPTQASEPEVEQSEGEDSDDNDDDDDDDTEDKPAAVQHDDDDDDDSEEMDRLLAEKRAKLAAIQAEEDESTDSDSLGVNA